MPVVGGDITEITCQHSVLGSFVFFPKAGEGSTIDLGGYRTNDDDAAIDGAGRTIRTINRKRWTLETVIANDEQQSEENQNLVALAGSPIEGTWTITMQNGVVYKGVGSPVGDLKADVNAATMPLKLSGGGANGLQKIS